MPAAIFSTRRSVFSSGLLPVFILLITAHTASAQFHQFRNYNVKDGLPSSEVYNMMQDSAGYLWFTTDMGVSRFDGYSFLNFSTENGLPDNIVFGATQDGKGRIWFRSFSGQLSYFEKDRIHTIPCNAALQKTLAGALISSLYIDPGDTIWIGTDRQFALQVAPGWTDKNIRRINFEKDGGYLCLFGNDFIFGCGLLGGNMLRVYERTGKELYSVISGPPFSAPIRYTVKRLAGGDLLMTANHTITRFNNGVVFAQKDFPSAGICMEEDGDGTIFTGTHNGAFSWTDLSRDEAAAVPGLEQKIITAICRDRENGLWFCTEGNGIFYLAQQDFLYYTPANGLSESKISCVTATDSGLVAGHLDGTIDIINGTTVRSFPAEDPGELNWQPNRMYSLFYCGSGKAIAASVTNIYTLDLKTTQTKIIFPSGAKKIIRSGDGNLWVLRYRYISKSPVDNFKLTEKIVMDCFTENMYEDRSGKLWICTMNGLWNYTDDAGLSFCGKENPLLTSRVVDLQESADGALWMVSRGNGVIVKKDGQYYHITQKDGLAGNMCRALLPDSNNVIWVGTNNGLSRITVTSFSPFRYTISNFTSKNGLLTNDVSTILRIGSRLWVVHNNGISVFAPSALQNNTQPPPVYITSAQVNDDTINPLQHSFAYDQNYFNIRFIGLSYKDPGAVEYKYRMEGIDSAWTYTAYTSVKYQTLPPGSYRFVVYAKNNDGFWSVSPATLSFVILPPWWQTWWFKLMAALVIILALVSVFRLRVSAIRRRERKKAELQKRIAYTELTALRAQMNPHFVFNAINSVQYFITGNDPESSQKYLSKFGRLIRYVLDNSKVTSIPVQKEIEALNLYLELEALRFGKHFEYRVKIDPNVDKQYTQIPSMLIQPYVENAIWHGIMHNNRQGLVTISLEMEGTILKCTVEDNGIGRKKSQELKQERRSEHQSTGMANTQERLEIINQMNKSNLSVAVTDLYTDSGEACGTRVVINIPCN